MKITQKIRKEVEQEMASYNMKLDIANTPNEFLNTTHLKWVIRKDYVQEDMAELNDLINKYKDCKGYRLTQSIKSKYCTKCGEFNKTGNIEYTITRRTFIPRYIQADTITMITKDRVREKIQNDIKEITGNDIYISLDCKIMELYKKGIITWDTVIESHEKGCEI